MSHYTWKALKDAPNPNALKDAQNDIENPEFSPVVYSMQILKGILTQTISSLPLIVEEAPTNQ